MKRNYTKEQKQQFVDLYTRGTKVSLMCMENNIPRSTMYYWLNKHKVIKRTETKAFTANDAYLLKKKLKKIEIENKILKDCECTVVASRKEKLETIAGLDGKYTIHVLCRALNVRRSTYYHYKLRRPEQTVIEKEDKANKPVIRKIFNETKGRIGAKKIRVLMLSKGYKTTAKRINRLMDEMSLVCISRKKKTQYNFTPAMKYRKNILKRDFNHDRPNKIWISDITNINLNYQPFYLCFVIDLFSRKVIAYKISDNKETDLVKQAFDKAYESEKAGQRINFS